MEFSCRKIFYVGYLIFELSRETFLRVEATGSENSRVFLVSYSHLQTGIRTFSSLLGVILHFGSEKGRCAHLHRSPI